MEASMKALVFKGPRNMQYMEVPTPEPGPGEVRIHPKAVSICGSDTSGYKGGNKMRTPGLIMGHEFSGVIEKLGPDVTGITVGQRVAVHHNIFCEKCRDCKEGRDNVCVNRAIIGTTMPVYGPYNGAMADYVIAPAKKIIPLPDHVSFNAAAMGEPLSIALRATEHVKILKDQTVLVYGAGPIGLLNTQCINTRGAASIIAVDTVDARLEFAKKCGASRTINSKNEDVQKIVAELTDSGGVDVVFDCVGVKETVNTGIKLVRCGGTVVWVGLSEASFEFDYKDAVCKEISFISAYMYTDELEKGLDLIAEGKLDVENIITGVYPMSEGAKHFELIAKGESRDIKIILTND
jgi:2-desacetyl-2-hydroxyethyl bacteriochlorophyllide A dehydrogenase